MIRPPAAEVRRTAGRGLVLALAAVLLATGGAALLAAPDPSRPLAIATNYYYEHGAYHVLGLVTTSDGQPVAGATVRFSLPGGLPTGGPVSARSDAGGLVAAVLPGPPGNYSITLSASNGAGVTSVTTEVTNWPVNPAEGNVTPGPGSLTSVAVGAYRSVGELRVFQVGRNGSLPVGYSVVYEFAQFETFGRSVGERPGASPAPPAPLATIPLGPLTSDSTVLPVSVDLARAGNATTIEVDVLDATGAVVDFADFPITAFGPLAPRPVAAQAADLALTELGLVATLAALLVGWSAYGADRLAGGLEPYLTRRIRPSELLAARFLGLWLPLSVGAAAGWTVAVVGLSLRYGAVPPTGVIVLGLLAVPSTLAAWLGTDLCLSHVVRTPLRLVTSGVFLLVVFGFLWGPVLTTALPYAGVPWGTPTATHLLFDANLFNPTTAPSALLAPALDGAALWSGAAIALVLLVWGLGPLSAALWRADRSD